MAPPHVLRPRRRASAVANAIGTGTGSRVASSVALDLVPSFD
jgi:hypothetical protein